MATTNVFLALALIAVVGSSLRFFLPDFDLDEARRICGRLVLVVFLPALNFEVVYRMPLDATFWRAPLVMGAAAIACALIGAVVLGVIPLPSRIRGSLVLASAFGNVTYLGMPVLQGLFPAQFIEVTRVAVLCEVTVTSLDLMVSSAIAPFYDGRKRAFSATLGEIARLPLLWAIILGALCNGLRVALPEFVMSATHVMGQTVSGLMLLVLGMALRPSAILHALEHPIHLLVPGLIKLAVSPLLVLFLARAVVDSPLTHHALVVEGAMPPQLIVLLAADRSDLDVDYLAAVVLTLTMISFVTVPIANSLL